MGLRQGEIIGLRWVDVDFARKTLRVAGQIQHGERTKAKTKHSHRTMSLSPDLVAVLRAHRQNQTEERNVSAEGWNAAGLVFCSENGTPLNPGNLTRQLDTLLRRAELPDIRFHDLRHTYAALSIAAGVDIYRLSRLMGHSSITVTADRYGHLFDQGKQQAADALDRLLKRGA